MDNKPELIANRFKVNALIGIGGLSSVYLGQDLGTKQPVAVKLLKPEIVQREPTIIARFKREATLLEDLEHPNIVKYITSGEEGDNHYIIMEYLGGGTLAQRIREKNQLTIQQVLEYGIDLTDALTRAHRLNVIHRDIKPTNIIFDKDDVPHLTDFGIAHLQDETHLTQIGSILGSYTYLSPEACNAVEVDQRTDIWSLGVTLYEMLAGRAPFEADTPGAVVNNILNKPVPNIREFRPDVPEPLNNLLQDMLAKDVDDRLDSMRVVGARLENIIRLIFTPTASIPLTLTASSRFDKTNTIPNRPAELGKTVIFRDAPSRFWQAIMIMLPLLIGIGIGIFVVFQNGDNDSAVDTTDNEILSVEPVAEDHYMVLVADFEAIDTDKRSVERFIYSDLQQKLERDLPYLNVELRQYQHIIESEADALQVAEANDATIIIWGDYTADRTEINIQIGDMQDFAYTQIPRELIDNTLNIRLETENSNEESTAVYVIGDLIVLHSANGETFNAATAILSLEELDTLSVVAAGNDTSARMHSYFINLFSNPQRSVLEMNNAIRTEPSNPILYHFRGLAYQRMGNFENSDQDLETASIVSNDEWYVSKILLAGQELVRNNPRLVVEKIEPVLHKNEEDWFIWFIRGTAYYLLEDYDNARADFEQSIALEPVVIFSHLQLAQIAMRQGDLDYSISIFEEALANYSDPEFFNRALLSIYGEESAEVLFYSYTLASYSNFLVGQYDQAIETATAALEIDEDFVDLYMLRGVSECSLGDYPAAEISYNKAIELDPEFYVLYLLRAEVLFKQNEIVAAINDIGVVQKSDQFDKLESYIELGINGEFDCSSFIRGRD